MDSLLCMCLTKYGFHTGQAYSRIGRTKAIKAVFIGTGSFDPNVLLIRPNESREFHFELSIFKLNDFNNAKNVCKILVMQSAK